MNLESYINQVMNGDLSFLENALLLLSNINESKLSDYKAKLNLIVEDFNSWTESNYMDCSNSLMKAKSLFDYLWTTKPERFNGDFSLAKVIDNQLNEDKNKRVGDCVGLTQLYSVLGLRLNIKGLKLLDCTILKSGAEGLEKLDVNGHILNTINQSWIIDNTNKDAFLPYQAIDVFYSNPKEIELNNLIPIVYGKRGGLKFEFGLVMEAVKDYTKAIELNPEDAITYYNRAHAKNCLGLIKEAISDYDKSIKINHDFSNAYFERGKIKMNLGLIIDGMNDICKGLPLNLPPMPN